MLRQPGDTILLVEDEEAAILLVQQAVASCTGDLHLVVVPNGLSALEWLNDEARQGRPLPRLILIDLKLPKLAGLAVLRALRTDERSRHLPIIVYSEIHESSDVLLSYQIGANSFVKKPENLPEFSQLLHELLNLNGLNGAAGMDRELRPSVAA
jgi:two-component system response regulator